MGEINFSSEPDISLKFNEQAVLIRYIEKILDLYNSQFSNEEIFDPSLNFQRAGVKYNNFATLRKFAVDPEQPSLSATGNYLDDQQRLLINKLFFRDEKFQNFFSNLHSDIKKNITANVLLYKTFIIKKDNNTSVGEEVSFLIPTINHTLESLVVTPEGIRDLSESTQKLDKLKSLPISEERKNGNIIDVNPNNYKINILSFNYEYKGTQTQDVDVSLDSELKFKLANPLLVNKKLKVSNFEDNIFPSNKIDLLQDRYFYFTDLLSTVNDNGEKNKQNQFEAYPYYIKAVINIECSESDIDETVLKSSGFESVQDINFYLDQMTTTLSLTPYKHEIKVNTDGSLDITVNYTAAALNNLHSQMANILAPWFEDPEYKKILDLEKQISDKKIALQNANPTAAKEGSPPADANTGKKAAEAPANTAKAEELEKELKNLINLLDKHKDYFYTYIFDQIIGKKISTNNLNGAKRGIYMISIPNESLGIMGSAFSYKVIDDITKTVKFSGSKKAGFDSASAERTAAAGGGLTNQEVIIDKIQRLSVEQLRENVNNEKTNLDVASEKTRGALDALADFGSAVANMLSSDKEKENLRKSKELKSRTEAANIPNTAQPAGESHELYFVFLGDILDIALSCLSKLAGESKPRIILGNILLHFPDTSKLQGEALGLSAEEKRISVNLADIPISLSLFKHFWTDEVKNKPPTITVKNFIESIIDKLLRPAISPSHFGKNINGNNTLKVGSISFELPMGEGGSDPIYNACLGSDQSLARDGKFYGVLSEGIMESIATENRQLRKQLIEQNGSLQYIVIHDTSVLPRELASSSGDIDKDKRAGVYHIGMYNSEAVVTDIIFTRMENNGIKEAAVERAAGGNSNMNVYVKQMYESEIKMTPALIFLKSGDDLYIDPLKSLEFSEAGNILGFNGYYMVNTAKYSFYGEAGVSGQAIIKAVQTAWVNQNGTETPK